MDALNLRNFFSALVFVVVLGGCCSLEVSPGSTPDHLCQPDLLTFTGAFAKTECLAFNDAVSNWEAEAAATLGSSYHWVNAIERRVDCESPHGSPCPDSSSCSVCKASGRPCLDPRCGADVLISRDSSFASPECWTGSGSGDDGWHIGDFNGDGRDDLFRVRGGTCGAEVLISRESGFASPECWTGSGSGDDGWHIGDFNGDGRDDLFRVRGGTCGAEVLISRDSSFASPECWTGSPNRCIRMRVNCWIQAV